MSAASLPALETANAAEGPPNLMFDPSSLLNRTAVAQLATLSRDRLAGENLFVPASFVRALNEPDLLLSVRRHFGPDVEQVSAGDILATMRAIGLQAFSTDLTAGRTDDVVSIRLIATRDRILRDIFLEEWTFLIQQSWIAARRKRVFNTFKRGGAAVMDFSGQRFDSLVARTLRQGRIPVPPTLTNVDRIRAAAKWIAVGGSSVAGLVDPILAAVAGVGTGMFLLFDP